jgi:hypothetical protein
MSSCVDATTESCIIYVDLPSLLYEYVVKNVCINPGLPNGIILRTRIGIRVKLVLRGLSEGSGFT